MYSTVSYKKIQFQISGDDRQVPAEPGQPGGVWREGVLHGGGQPVHTQEQGEDGRLPGSFVGERNSQSIALSFRFNKVVESLHCKAEC